MKILSLLSYSPSSYSKPVRVSFFCWTQKKISWGMLVTKQLTVAIDIYSMAKHTESQWLPSIWGWVNNERMFIFEWTIPWHDFLSVIHSLKTNLDLELLKLERDGADVTHTHYLSKCCKWNHAHLVHKIDILEDSNLTNDCFVVRSKVCFLATVLFPSSGSVARTDSLTRETHKATLSAEPAHSCWSSQVRCI